MATDTEETAQSDEAATDAAQASRRTPRPRIKEAVKEVLEELGIIGDDTTEPAKEEQQKAEVVEGPRQQEANAETGMREALKSVLKEHEHEREHAELKKEEKKVEEAPRQVGRLTRMLWGDQP